MKFISEIIFQILQISIPMAEKIYRVNATVELCEFGEYLQMFECYEHYEYLRVAANFGA